MMASGDQLYQGSKAGSLTLKEQGGKHVKTTRVTDQSVHNMPLNDEAEHEMMMQSGECII